MLNICGFGRWCSFFDSFSEFCVFRKVRNIDVKEVLPHELAGVPVSVLNESSDMDIFSSIS